MNYFFIDDLDFGSLLKRAIRRVNDKSNENSFVKKHILQINKYVQKIKEQNPNISFEELKEIFNSDYLEILDTLTENSFIFEHTMQYESSLFLAKNKNKAQHLIAQYRENPDSFPTKYNQDFENNLRVVTKFLCDDYDEFMSDELFEEDFFIKLKSILDSTTIKQSEKTKFINSSSNGLSINSKKMLKKFLTCYNNREFGYIDYEINTSENDLIDCLAKSISSIGNQLDKFGFLERYPEQQTATFVRTIGIPEFSHSFNSSSQNIGLEYLKNYSFMKSQNLETLLALNTFWYNRFLKEFDLHFESIFAINQLNLLEQMYNNNFDENSVSIDDIDGILKKLSILYIPTYNFWKHKNKESEIVNDDDQFEKEFETERYYFFSTRELLDSIPEGLEDEYEGYLDYITGIENNSLPNDIKEYWKLFSPIFYGYSVKNDCIISSLTLSQFKNLSQNYGIVLDEETLTKKRRSKFFNFWMDFKGLNFPLREHMPINVLRSFLKTYQGTNMIPLYLDEGAYEDINSNILFPLSKKQTKILKDAKKDNYTSYKSEKAKHFLKHLNFVNSKVKIKDTDKIYLNIDDFELYKYSEDSGYERFIIDAKKPFDSTDVDFNFDA